VNFSCEWFVKRFRLMSLCATIIPPDVGSIAHTEYLVDIFSTLSVYGNSGLKALLSRGKQRKGLKCACPTWRAWLALPFYMLIPSTGENLGSKAHATNLEGEFFLPHIWTQFWLWDPICAPKLWVLDKCEYELWRIRWGLSFDMLAAVLGLNLGPRSHTVLVL
jgi:hypothetical protein